MLFSTEKVQSTVGTLNKQVVMKLFQMLDKQRAFFRTQKTKPVEFRREQLLKLKSLLEEYQPRLIESLYKDLRRSPEVTVGVEMRRIMNGLDHTIEHFADWAKNVEVSCIVSPKRINCLNSLVARRPDWQTSNCKATDWFCLDHRGVQLSS